MLINFNRINCADLIVLTSCFVLCCSRGLWTMVRFRCLNSFGFIHLIISGSENMHELCVRPIQHNWRQQRQRCATMTGIYFYLYFYLAYNSWNNVLPRANITLFSATVRRIRCNFFFLFSSRLFVFAFFLYSDGIHVRRATRGRAHILLFVLVSRLVDGRTAVACNAYAFLVNLIIATKFVCST